MRPSIRKYFVLALLFALWGQVVAHAEAGVLCNQAVSPACGNNNPPQIFQ